MKDYTKIVEEINKDICNTIVRDEVMVPICNVGPLFEYIELLEYSNKKLTNKIVGLAEQ